MMEEKLTKAEAEKSMLREDDFNITTSSSESYKFPSDRSSDKG